MCSDHSLSTSFFGRNQCNSHQFTWLRRWFSNECLFFCPDLGRIFSTPRIWRDVTFVLSHGPPPVKRQDPEMFFSREESNKMNILIWLVVSIMAFIFHFIYYMGCHPSHWRTPSFFNMIKTTKEVNFQLTNRNPAPPCPATVLSPPPCLGLGFHEGSPICGWFIMEHLI